MKRFTAIEQQGHGEVDYSYDSETSLKAKVVSF